LRSKRSVRFCNEPIRGIGNVKGPAQTTGFCMIKM
jgi:hypothetical protein